ncbi:MAG: protein kinase [Polyangiaceae bacterium]
MLSEGERIEHYVVERRLGEGGMGAVYRAKDTKLERIVALKVLELDGTPPDVLPDYVARLRREALAAASLSHPAIVSIYDVGEAPGLVFYAMEYVEGRPLRDLVGRPEVSWTERLRWLVDIARALDAAHATGLVHRDIKPENVMVRADGLVKVLDFGIARKAQGEHGEPLITKRGEILGTPAYMSPEQLGGGEPEAASDQFSWGVLAYELLCGERPWKATGNLLALVTAMVQETPVDLAERVPEVPRAVSDVVMRAIHRATTERHESMGAIAKQLEPFASQTTVLADRITFTTLPHEVPHDAFAATTRVPTVRSEPPQEAPKSAPAKKTFFRGGKYAIGGALVMLAATLVYRNREIKKPMVVQVCGNDRAEKTYRSALQLQHDGAESGAIDAFERASKEDPECAAAHLKAALLLAIDNRAAATEHHLRAFENRDRLMPRDMAVLDAAEVLVAAKPDPSEYQTRILRALRKYPNDPELHAELGRVRTLTFDYEGARDAYAKSVQLDSTYAPAYAGRARAYFLLGDPKRALADYGQCLDHSPVAAVCVAGRHAVLVQTGACMKAKEDAEQWTHMDPQSAEAQSWLASDLFSTGAPRASVDEVLKREWPLRASKDHELQDRALLSIYDGDFTNAERILQAWEKALPPSATRTEHATPLLMLAEVYLEIGDMMQAARWAKNYLDRSQAWQLGTDATDPAPRFLRILHAAGHFLPAEYEEKQRQWLRQEEEMDLRHERERQAGERWLFLYGEGAGTSKEARDAIEALPRFSPLPVPTRRSPDFLLAMGRVQARAGRPGEARNFLSPLVEGCKPFGAPFVYLRGAYEYGTVLEALGEVASARKWYALVLTHWKNAKPRSVTADNSASRLLGLKEK